MNHILKFELKYFLFTLLLLFTEICIALFFHDDFIRPYIGDTLVVILIYCFIKSFLNLRVIPTAISVLLFSFIVETLQYFKIVMILGLQNSKLARIIIGTSFSWEDIIAYCGGITLVISLEKYVATPKKSISTE
ncbi:DUF2809 domain-containing protein [Leptospira kmetyi]|uniref:ribosomal maturation YjgA family protein n=1 Tax=Leptospira kmetyi TaxID=408139 RepID=UPI001082C78C|nr:DUF2809 domain-containing protein [Leptospira kmetyi]